VTIILTERLARIDLHDFNVVVLPVAFSFRGGGGYGPVLGESAVAHLRDWIQNGGTLITLGTATRWLTGEDVSLLSTSLKSKTHEAAASGKEGAESDQAAPDEDAEAAPEAEAAAIQAGLPPGVIPEEEKPTPLPGTILRAQLDPKHWLAFGYGARTNLIAQSRNIYEPIKIDTGLNVATYLPDPDELLVSGVAWPEELNLIAGTPYLMYQPLGRGHIVAFAEDPNFRAYFDGLNLLFVNAVMLGPGY